MNPHYTTGGPTAIHAGDVTFSPGVFPSPLEEYLAAFEDEGRPFLIYHRAEESSRTPETLTRGAFFERARRAATCLLAQGMIKGDRVIHCFSANHPVDLILRLAEVLIGAAPVTINWQADNEERIKYKIAISQGNVIFYDRDFTPRIKAIAPALVGKTFVPLDALEDFEPLSLKKLPSLRYEDEKGIIFTSGTTGNPKGVILSHLSYLTNRQTFDDYFQLSPSSPLELFLVNPLHHTNSSALCDWAMGRKNAVLHLAERYSTRFWSLLAAAAKEKKGLFITSLVPRHFDFLERLYEEERLPLEKEELKKALAETEILIGSAPVGPQTMQKVIRFSGRTPHVRFGSTEACLEVAAIPFAMDRSEVMAACETGWNHRYDGEKAPGYYIGREHYPFTQVRVVRALDPGQAGCMEDCAPGEPGYLITRGGNLMAGYLGQETPNSRVFREGWYTGLRDIGFFLPGMKGGTDLYWSGRDSAMLIRGGANYAYEQVAADLAEILRKEFHIPPDKFAVAVVGLTLTSEHEDSCCVTIELSEGADLDRKELLRDFTDIAATVAPKGCRPDHVRLGKIPRSFKGAILYRQLKEEFRKYLNNKNLRMLT